MATSACSQAAACAALNALAVLLNGGTIKIFSGAMPTNTELPDSGTLLSSGMSCSIPAFAPSVPNASPRGALATANPVAMDNSAAATGTAGYWRAYGVDGACVLQGTCVKTGSVGAMILNTTAIVANATVSCTAWTIALPDGS